MRIAAYDFAFRRQVDVNKFVLVRSSQTFETVVDNAVAQRLWIIEEYFR